MTEERKNVVKKESRKIKLSILIFVIGNIVFLSACVASVWYGGICIYKFFTKWYLHDWEKFCVLIGFGGLILFFQIIIELFQKGNVPKRYKEISNNTHSELFSIIDNVRQLLNISKPIRVFLVDTASASIFVLPDVQNIIKKPERFLVIGNLLIENLTEEELKAILLHEFAHIVQDEINDTARASSIGLFANSFLSERIEFNANYGPGSLTQTMMILYYAFMDYLCRHIKRHSELLTDELEYEADRIVLQYIGPQIFADALLHIIKLSGKVEIPLSVRKRIERLGVALPAKQEKSSTNGAKIHIHLAHRRHFTPLVDFKYSILLNGKDIGEGNLIKGFTIEKDITHGLYTIEVASYISTLSLKPYIFEADAGYTYHIELDYKHLFWRGWYVVFCKEMKVFNNN
ncbi:MAG: M48 family metalloprotease [Prevotella sp.]|nr:M48 family metalloprotease [Prevotella sp.]